MEDVTDSSCLLSVCLCGVLEELGGLCFKDGKVWREVVMAITALVGGFCFFIGCEEAREAHE